jgi:hypothetical protein
LNDYRYWLATERLEALRAEAASDRMVRSADHAIRKDRRSLRLRLGVALVRIGRAVGGLGVDRERFDDRRARAELVNKAES